MLNKTCCPIVSTFALLIASFAFFLHFTVAFFAVAFSSLVFAQPLPEPQRMYATIVAKPCYEVAASFNGSYVPSAVNTAGMVVGTYRNLPQYRAFRYFHGATEFLFPSEQVSFAQDINHWGDVVGDLGYFSAFLLQGTQSQTVSVPGAYRTSLSAINRNGLATGTVKLTDNEECSFTDRPILRSLDGNITTVNHAGCGVDINSSGTVVARFSPTSYLGDGYLVSSSGQYLSALPHPGEEQFPAAINDSGKVVGVGGVGLIAHAMAWYGTQAQSLPVPSYPNTRVQSAATDINNQGMIVGTAAIYDFDGGFERNTALVWPRNSGVSELNSLICPDLNLTHFTRALRVTDNGKILAEYQDGAQYYLLKPRVRLLYP